MKVNGKWLIMPHVLMSLFLGLTFSLYSCTQKEVKPAPKPAKIAVVQGAATSKARGGHGGRKSDPLGNSCDPTDRIEAQTGR